MRSNRIRDDDALALPQSDDDAPAPPALPQPRRAWRSTVGPALLALIVFIVSLTVRFWNLDLVITTDEGYWMQRSVRFAAALDRRDWGGTFRAGHPGVTVMWAATLGVRPTAMAPLFPDRYIRPETLQRAPSYLTVLSEARRAVAVIVSLLVAVAVLLGWRLFGSGAAVLGGVLLTADPYVIGMTRLLHVDALLAPLMLVSVLAALTYWTVSPRLPYLVLSAAAGALALLTKAPAAVLPLFAALLGLWTTSTLWKSGEPPGKAIKRGMVPVVVWGVVAGALYLLLFPAMWVDPLVRAQQLIAFVREVGLQPHNGNFFLGQPVLDDPGPLYYFIAVPLRMSPLVALGLATLVLPAGPKERRRAIHGALVFAVLFTVVMTLGSKKFDRYLLPVLMVLDLVAGVGLWRAARLIWSRAADERPFFRAGAGAAGAAASVALVVALVQGVLLVRVWPYPIAYYNPLAGGPERARDLIMVGWGEGLEQVGAFLSGLPEAERLTVVTSYNQVMRPRFPGETVPIAPYMRGIANMPTPDYLVLYVNSVQRRQLSPEVAFAQTIGEPVFVAKVNGLEYAWVYYLPRRGPRPIAPMPMPIEDPNEGEEN